MSDAQDRRTIIAAAATLPDAAPDHDAKPMPQHVSDVLYILAILVEYGRHLLDTIQRRAGRAGFSTIAQFFGTARIPVILAHLQRGIMRAVALERLLLERARTGRDLVLRSRRDATARAAKPHAPSPATASAAPPDTPSSQPAARRPAPQEPLTPDTIPSMRAIEAEVRSRPIGRTLVAISLDFGLAPLLCAAPFGTDLFNLFRWYGGSFGKYFMEIRRREKRFDQLELDHNPALGRPAQTRDEVRQILGFFAGEHPFDPFAPQPGPAPSPAPGMVPAAAATGPP